MDWPLCDMWIAEEGLDAPPTLDVVTVVFRLDVPAEELPWLALHPMATAVEDALRLRKIPVWCRFRPIGWPSWNAIERRVARFWDVATGLDERVIETLEKGGLVDALEVSPDEYTRQMETELAISRSHLVAVVDEYWEPDWRRQHRGLGIYPEDHLWRAAEAVHELEAALGRAATA